MVEWFRSATWWEILLIALVLNVVTMASSVALWRRRVDGEPGALAATRPVTARDRWLAASTVAVNAAIVLPAWWLWRDDRIRLVAPTVPRVLLELAYLLVGLETIMYVVHRLFHQGVLYRWFHSVHHTDDAQMSPLTLFVMHPGEPAGFGLAMLAMLWAWPVSVVAIAVFYGINLWMGTFAHLPWPADRPVGRLDALLGGSCLHQGHHVDEATNFGFFTRFWDRVLGTNRYGHS